MKDGFLELSCQVILNEESVIDPLKEPEKEIKDSIENASWAESEIDSFKLARASSLNVEE